MSRHDGVSCDSCLKGNFRGRRYKCLICYDYDLCATCYEAGSNTTRHTADHAMQCILTRTDFDLYFGGEALPAEHPQSFTCPFCGKMGYTETLLQEHVTSEHTDTSAEVVCPICAAVPGGDPNHVTDDFAAHITLEHRVPREFEEPTGMRHVRRIPHPNRGAGSTRTRRTNMHFAGSNVAGLSPSSRETMDPIAELLSQLSSVRSRAAAAQSVSSQLQQLEMQLQSTRQQLERLPRRQPDASGLVVRPPTAVTNAAAVGAGVTTATTADLLSISNHNTNYSRANSQFLLARVGESPACDVDQSSSSDSSLADRSLFVQELLLSTLTDHLHLNELSDIAKSIAKADVDVETTTTSDVVAKGVGEACSEADAADAECSDNTKTEILISSDSDKNTSSNSSSCSSLSESAVAIVPVVEDNKMSQRPPPASESNENTATLQAQTNTNTNNATRRRNTNSIGTNTTGTSMSAGSGVSLPPPSMHGQVMLAGSGGGGTRNVAASLGSHSGVVGLGSGNAPHPNRSLMAAAAVRDPRHNPTAAKRSLLKPHVEATKKTEPPPH